MPVTINFSQEVSDALRNHGPIVALESTVIAHGLPYPQNLETALSLEAIVRIGGATPATIAFFGGEVVIGLNELQLKELATRKDIRKISRRDISIAIAAKLDCATTVATTTYFAHRAGIKVFSTGGIGGVHRGSEADISADLPELAQTPITVVCSGAKIVLDLPKTREWLETNGVTVLGWRCDEMPAFYSQTSSQAVDERVENAIDVARIVAVRDELELKNSILVTVPVPREYEIPIDILEKMLSQLIQLAGDQNVSGKEVTPFLLSNMAEASNGQTLAANIALLENNAKVATEIALAINS